MKKIEILIEDDVMSILDGIAQSYDYRKYPKEQVYRIILSEMLRSLTRGPICPCCYVPPHCHIPSWWL